MNSSTQVQDYHDSFIETLSTAARLVGILKTITVRDAEIKNKPWFDSECRIKFRETKNRYKVYKKCKKVSALLEYLQAKKIYKNLVKISKSRYHDNIRAKLANIKNSKEFWETVRSFSQKNRKELRIDIATWQNYIAAMFTGPPNEEYTIFGVTHPFFDDQIKMAEVENAISKAKRNKSPGLDHLPYEAYKNITPEYKLSLVK